MSETREQILRRARSLADAETKLMEQLTSLRETHNLSQSEIADRMGVSQSAISQLERHDSNPTLATIRRYALAVEATLDIEVQSDRTDTATTAHVADNRGTQLWVHPGHTASTSVPWEASTSVPCEAQRADLVECA